MAGVKLASAASFSEQPDGGGEAERKQESSLWELLGGNLCGRGDIALVPCLICSGTSRLLDLSSQSEGLREAFYPFPASHEANPSSSLCRVGQVANTVSADKQGAGEQRGAGAWASVSQEIGSDLQGWSWLICLPG